MTGNTIFSAYNDTKEKLKTAGIEDYGFEARVIIRHVTGFDNKEILINYNNVLTVYQQKELESIVERRRARYPLQYILGEWSFYGRTFRLGEGVLIPRGDTETVVETALELIKNVESPGILDLCAGSGAIGLTLALERTDSRVILLEKYETALGFAAKNKELLGAYNAECVKGDVLSGDLSSKRFDLIVSNPPYVSKEDMKALQPELAFEPKEALCPGEDEFLFYKKTVENYKRALNPGGFICFEVGKGMAESVEKILSSAGFAGVDSRKDFADIERVVFGTVT